MSVTRKFFSYNDGAEAGAFYKDHEQQYTLTPFIVTFCEDTLADIDVQNFLEAGLKIIRFRMTHNINEKVVMHEMLKSAIELCCLKYEVSAWPVATMIDLPNALVRTGYIKEELNTSALHFKKGHVVEITCDDKYWNKCDLSRIYIDDPQMMDMIKPKQEICIPVASLNLICTEIINKQTIKCEIISNGRVANYQVVCFRGLRLKRPPLTNQDLNLLNYAKENEATDGIVLAREYISESILNINQMQAIQLSICAKCKRVGKPIFISGDIFDETVTSGGLSYNEVDDVTNIILQGAGLMFRSTHSPANVLKSLYLLNYISSTVEQYIEEYHWRLIMELKPPVNAAEAAVIACAIAARQINATVIIVLTKTGKTVKQLSRITPKSFIVAVATDVSIVEQLYLFHGVIPIIYDRKEKEDWYMGIKRRIEFAVEHCVNHELLKHHQPYAVLRKASPESAYCDQFSLYTVKRKF
ncbi:unnamed protein product [Chilo suppressalis]|uniref:pyruvate kinase n=1 Tax=Chilo suppressalis TaxID=168631 RepID=A0ABN8LCK9_CHISP|nr:unnamed protein product [Chilo suppressalis]